ncbi:MAG: preprotein translocase subunit SecF [Frankiales bacterium]|jgi:preprotein translocase subunit SecF|nr:preprotein translocase subunit SecF [Frankiales bacterium]
MASGGLRNVAHRLYAGDISYDFIGRRRWWYLLSSAVMLVSLGSLLIIGIKPSIDFKGGTQFDLPGVTSISQTQAAMARAGFTGDNVVVQNIGSGSSKHIRITTGILTNGSDKGSSNQVNQVETQLSKTFNIPTTKISLNTVGATWGNQITKKAIESLVVFLVVVVIYLSIRFQPKMAAAAIIALVHDLLITAGIYSLVGFEVSPATVVALLTILGYSLYDTVVVFDKVRENTAGIGAGSKLTYSQAANLAVNQTLVRSINTSIIALLPVAGLLFIGVGLLGAGTLKDLALALFIGLATGAYSSIFVATPLLTEMKEREPAMIQLRKKVAMREAAEAKAAREGSATAGPTLPVAADADAAVPVDDEAGELSGTGAGRATGGTRPPVRRKPASRPGTKRRR